MRIAAVVHATSTIMTAPVPGHPPDRGSRPHGRQGAGKSGTASGGFPPSCKTIWAETGRSEVRTSCGPQARAIDQTWAWELASLLGRQNTLTAALGLAPQARNSLAR